MRIRSREVLIDLMARSEEEFVTAELLGHEHEANVAQNNHQKAIEEFQALESGLGDQQDIIDEAAEELEFSGPASPAEETYIDLEALPF